MCLADKILSQQLDPHAPVPDADAIEAVLSELEEKITRQYNKTTFLSYEHNRSQDDEYEYDRDEVSRLGKVAQPWLVRVIAGQWAGQRGEMIVERAAAVMAHLCGRAASGEFTRTWHFTRRPPNEETTIQVQIHEGTLTSDDLGFKTWDAAPLLARRIVCEDAIPDLASQCVLELGAGTGLVGLACAKMGARKVVLSDYHDEVIANVLRNCRENQTDHHELASSSVEVVKLDWRDVVQQQQQQQQQQFDVIVASDVVYEMFQAECVPVVVDRCLLPPAGVFYLMTPLRPTHWDVVNRFEEKMLQLGFCALRIQHEIGFDGMQFRYTEWKRQNEITHALKS